jgi:hypothetical protein
MIQGAMGATLMANWWRSTAQDIMEELAVRTKLHSIAVNKWADLQLRARASFVV